MRFDPDDLDWLWGELHHAIDEGKERGRLLHVHDAQLCAEAMQFFAAWQAELRTAHAASQSRESQPRQLFIPDRPIKLVEGRWVR